MALSTATGICDIDLKIGVTGRDDWLKQELGREDVR